MYKRSKNTDLMGHVIAVESKTFMAPSVRICVTPYLIPSDSNWISSDLPIAYSRHNTMQQA